MRNKKLLLIIFRGRLNLQFRSRCRKQRFCDSEIIFLLEDDCSSDERCFEKELEHVPFHVGNHFFADVAFQKVLFKIFVSSFVFVLKHD